jgi:hypothetical protein
LRFTSCVEVFPFKLWRESCDCPGAEEKRQRLNDAGIEPPDFGEIRAEAERRSRARREALRAARLASAGKSITEIQDLYVAELRARGLRIQRAEVPAAGADRIRGNPLPSYKLAGEGLVQLGKATVKIARLFRDITKPPA